MRNLRNKTEEETENKLGNKLQEAQKRAAR